MKKRIVGLDCIKGIAIILMVYGHSSFVGSLSHVQHEINGYIYTFHMPLFYVISGFLFSPCGGLLSLKKTCRYILLPYVIFLTLYLFGLSYANAKGFSTTGHVGPLSVTFLTVLLSLASAKMFDVLKMSKCIFSKTHIYQPMIPKTHEV